MGVSDKSAGQAPKYTLVEDRYAVVKICQQILSSFPPPVLGVDCEGLLRNQPISLLQLSFNGHSYLFDLQKVDPFDHRLPFNLKQILTSKKFVKIFHDFCEDCSALINHHGVYCEHVFDTQIAHRVISSATKNLTSGWSQN